MPIRAWLENRLVLTKKLAKQIPFTTVEQVDWKSVRFEGTIARDSLGDNDEMLIIVANGEYYWLYKSHVRNLPPNVPRLYIV